LFKNRSVHITLFYVHCLPRRLNSRKSETRSLDAIRDNGISLLGTCVGPRTARHAFLDVTSNFERKLIERLPSLKKQHALLLLRISVRQNLRHLQRSLYSADLTVLWDRLDSLLRNCVHQIRSLGPSLDEMHRAIEEALISLPIRLGALRHSIIRQMRPTCVCSSERVSRHSPCPNSSINPAHQRADAVPE